ncbi:GroES-like protein [Gonapodya prolifera JEL478]|uniref:GroES-like protein n=1 Tax=Gonapodya prolifera (strain JEL478) TaxID=1344416 RepID=A0A139AIY6_GONPJ|nr:GroES-like protein [Gonapodya prolifera JEL478]|eukprot:KXS16747.1 GroES-like protein [Gonapodya prolifera JEL478]
MKACGICGADLHFYKGDHANIPYGFCLGHEGSGEIVEVGAGVINVKSGDRVCIEPQVGQYSGLITHFYKHKADKVHKINDHVTYEEAAFVEPLAVGLNGVRRGEIGKTGRKNVIIIGAGPIGAVSILCSKAEGAKWVGTCDLLEARLQAAKKIGADATLLTKPSMTSDEVAAALQTLHPVGESVDVIIDAVGITSTLNTAFKLQTTRSPRRAYYGPHYPDAARMVNDGVVDVKPLITHRISMDQFEEGFRLLLDGNSGAGKVIFQL